MKVVYFNQWFSSIANVIDDLKAKHGRDILFIASSKNKEHVYRYSVDIFVEETWEEGETWEETLDNYTQWILNLCKVYKVDVFFVKRHAKYIMKKHAKFLNNNTLLVSEDYDTLKRFEKKSEVYNTLKNTLLCDYIPKYNVFDNIYEAIDFVNNNRKRNEICLKLDIDEGGASFRAINDTKLDFKSLLKNKVNTITSDEAIEIINSEHGKIGKLLFMEILDSPEISVDCYNSKKGFIAICREKEQNSRKQRIYYDKDIANICNKIRKELDLKFPFNVQFRIKHNSDKTNKNNIRLLEINPRMSGGLYYEIETGLNIAEVCLLDALNKEHLYNINNFIAFDDKYVTYVEKAIKI